MSRKYTSCFLKIAKIFVCAKTPTLGCEVTKVLRIYIVRERRTFYELSPPKWYKEKGFCRETNIGGSGQKRPERAPWLPNTLLSFFSPFFSPLAGIFSPFRYFCGSGGGRGVYSRMFQYPVLVEPTLSIFPAAFKEFKKKKCVLQVGRDLFRNLA